MRSGARLIRLQLWNGGRGTKTCVSVFHLRTSEETHCTFTRWTTSRSVFWQAGTPPYSPPAYHTPLYRLYQTSADYLILVGSCLKVRETPGSLESKSANVDVEQVHSG